MVKVGKLWGDAKFASMSPFSKLLYCYLISQPSITTLGFLVLDLDRVKLDLKIEDDDQIDESLSELAFNYYIDFYFENESIISLLVLGHFKSLPKSKSNIRKAIDEGKLSEGDRRDMLLQHFNSSDFKDSTSFTPPTAQEVSDYALSIGFLVDGKAFVEYYGDNDWYDKNNKKVRNWKAKCRKVWCKDERRLESIDGAPEGYEYYYITLEDGKRIQPTSWRGGYPEHSDVRYAQLLYEAYEHDRNSY